MKLTTETLKRMIREELENVKANEGISMPDIKPDPEFDEDSVKSAELSDEEKERRRLARAAAEEAYAKAMAGYYDSPR